MSVKKLIAGKHSCVGHLSAGGETSENRNRLEKPAMLVYAGKFDSMDGEVDITEDHIDKLVANHNAAIEDLSRLSTTPEQIERGAPPLQVDHSTSAHDTVGRVVGKLSKGVHKLSNGTIAPALMCERIVVLGAENVEKVADGRWVNVSIGADLEKCTLSELSITPFPAAPNAALLKAGNLSEGDKMETKEEMKARHLTEKEALSAAHADELKSKRLEEVKGKHEEQLQSLTEKHAEELKKLGVDPETDNKKAAEEDQKMAAAQKEHVAKLAAAKPNLITLAKKIKTSIDSSRLAAKEQMISAKISRLRFSAKITPAEQKKMNLTELAKQTDSELDSFFKGYEIREDVIDTRFHGTTKALTLSNLSRLGKDKRMSVLETEARLSGIGNPPSDDQRKEFSTVGPTLPQQSEALATDAGWEHMSKELSAMLGEHESKDAVIAHVKKMMDAKHMSETPSESAEHSEKQMSALANDVKKLQNEFQDLIVMIGDVTGIQKSELE